MQLQNLCAFECLLQFGLCMSQLEVAQSSKDESAVYGQWWDPVPPSSKRENPPKGWRLWPAHNPAMHIPGQPLHWQLQWRKWGKIIQTSTPCLNYTEHTVVERTCSSLTQTGTTDPTWTLTAAVGKSSWPVTCRWSTAALEPAWNEHTYTVQGKTNTTLKYAVCCIINTLEFQMPNTKVHVHVLLVHIYMYCIMLLKGTT